MQCHGTSTQWSRTFYKVASEFYTNFVLPKENLKKKLWCLQIFKGLFNIIKSPKFYDLVPFKRLGQKLGKTFSLFFGKLEPNFPDL